MRVSIPLVRPALMTLALAAGVVSLTGSACQQQQTPEPQTPTQDDGSTDEDLPVRTIVDPTAPVGSVAGEVKGFVDDGALSGVQVTLLVGKDTFSTQTDDAGLFRVEAVPAGGMVHVVLTRDGFHSAELDVFLDDEAGNFPSGNAHAFVGPVVLIPFGDTPLSVRVLTQDGLAASGVRVLMDLAARYALQGGGGMTAAGVVHQEATTDGEGNAAFNMLPDPVRLAARLPGLSVQLTVAPYAPSGGPGTAGETRTIPVSQLATQGTQVVVVVQPLQANAPLEVLASNVPDLITNRVVPVPGMVEASTATTEGYLRLVFNQPVDLGTLDAVVVAEDGSPLNPNGTPTRLDVVGSDGGGLSSTVQLILPRAPPGTEANLSIRAATPSGRAWEDSAALYFTQTEELGVTRMVQLTSNNPDLSLGAGEQVELILNQPVGGRDVNGSPVGTGTFIPIIATLTRPGTSIRAEATLYEPTPPAPFVKGGYTTRLRLTVPNDVTLGLGPAAVQVKLEFNDAAIRDGGPSGGGQARVTTPQGTPLTLLNGSAVLTLLAADTPATPDAGPGDGGDVDAAIGP
ncbi:MAG: hypothetical protein AB2A00_22260 [Myxococcota bacterium]